jgi:hypothetical protein
MVERRGYEVIPGKYQAMFEKHRANTGEEKKEK